MRYHTKTLELLGIKPRRSAAAVKKLDRVEHRIGRKFPASVREWYSLEGACELLRKYSNDDPPLKIDELGQPYHNAKGSPHDLLTRNLLVFRYENQAVCVWAVKLDGSDDPPVVVGYDSQFKIWKRCAATFSKHMYAWMWDYALVLQASAIQAQNWPLSARALAFLRRHFERGPMTRGWPGHAQYRFFREDQRILIWASDDQADWWLAADQEDSLCDLVCKVWECDDVGASLWGATEKEEAVLERARSRT